MSFQDHFSRTAAGYAAYRPTYPPTLFAALAHLAPALDIAWDCATGSGQAALGLAEHVDRVIATDASDAQIAAATPHERVEYRVARAEASGLPDASLPLVTVAQAVHWFDLDAFWSEVRRVLRPRGVIAVWCYGMLEIDADIDPLVDELYSGTVGPYWPPERRLVEGGYRDLPFPFEEIVMPPMWMEHALTLPALAGYLGTWSAVQRYRDASGGDPIAPLVASLAERWGPPDRARTARWPLGMRVGRMS